MKRSLPPISRIPYRTYFPSQTCSTQFPLSLLRATPFLQLLRPKAKESAFTSCPHPLHPVQQQVLTAVPTKSVLFPAYLCHPSLSSHHLQPRPCNQSCLFYLFTIFGCVGSSLRHGVSLVVVSRSYFLTVVLGLLIAVASLIGEHGL